MGFGHDFAHDLNGAFASGAVNVTVGHKANRVECGVQGKNAVRLERLAKLYRVETGAFSIENDNVSTNGRGFEDEIRSFSNLTGHVFCVCVILVEAFRRFFERDEASSS